jgi:hypothetical protein
MVAAFDIVSDIPILAQHPRTAVSFNQLMQLTILRVVMQTCDSTFGLHL